MTYACNVDKHRAKWCAHVSELCSTTSRHRYVQSLHRAIRLVHGIVTRTADMHTTKGGRLPHIRPNSAKSGKPKLWGHMKICHVSPALLQGSAPGGAPDFTRSRVHPATEETCSLKTTRKASITLRCHNVRPICCTATTLSTPKKRSQTHWKKNAIT